MEGPLDNMQTSLMSFPPPVKGRMDHRKLYFTALAQGTHAAASSQVRGVAIVKAIVHTFRHCCCTLLLLHATCSSQMRGSAIIEAIVRAFRHVVLHATACYSALLHDMASCCM